MDTPQSLAALSVPQTGRKVQCSGTPFVHELGPAGEARWTEDARGKMAVPWAELVRRVPPKVEVGECHRNIILLFIQGAPQEPPSHVLADT